jgi:hypothetical protein
LRDDVKIKPLQQDPNAKPAHILLVEGNLEMSQFITDFLKDDYRVSSAKDDREGLAFLADQKNRPNHYILSGAQYG